MKLLLILALLLFILLLVQQLLGNALIGQKKKYSIGIYEGDDPLSLHASDRFHNPIMTKFDVTDVKASFVADPFLIKEKETYYLFMEVKSKRKSDIGEIAVATGKSLDRLRYDRVVLREDYHLSYPHIFKVDGKYYMVPESGADRNVKLYEATHFPYAWRVKEILLEGKNFADPDLFFHNGLWWLLVSDETTHALEIYYSDRFDGPFHPHPKNPLYEGNKQRYRNAGKILQFQGRLYRFVQDCSRYYGEKVDAYEITRLDREDFAEEKIKTLLAPTGKGWNAKQMHQVDYLFDDGNGKWIAVVDGGSDEKENYYAINRFFRSVGL